LVNHAFVDRNASSIQSRDNRDIDGCQSGQTKEKRAALAAVALLLAPVLRACPAGLNVISQFATTSR
jgi:hypothetical protein